MDSRGRQGEGQVISEYLLYFFMVLPLSILFSMGGAGSGIAVIPLLHLLGIDFNLAKAVGLFTGFSTTFTSTLMNIKRKALDIAFVLPLAVTMWISAPIGAQLARVIDERPLQWFFVIFLLFSATMMIFFKKEPKMALQKRWIMALIGAVAGVMAGLLGVGGGNMLLPVLILLGFEARKVAIAVSFTVPLSAFGTFLSYASFVDIDWILLAVCAAAAVIGGYIGNYMMHFRLSQRDIKRIIALLLYILAFKMAYTLSG